jgi:hypothetical protein
MPVVSGDRLGSCEIVAPPALPADGASYAFKVRARMNELFVVESIR